jgi:arginyl-tRNA synthetase
VTDFEDSSAPFLLYNSTRLSSLVNKFEARVTEGVIPPSPPLDQMDFSLMDNDIEWTLLMEHVLTFSLILKAAAAPTLPEPPALPDYGAHKVSQHTLLKLAG